ncbi:MAG: hypothetical protein IJO74_04045 [Clostridia bacterium]|nr:hypothetical protein [Clostridia bacterium]
MRNTNNKGNFCYGKYLIVLVLILITALPCHAADISDDIIRYSGADMLENHLPRTLKDSGVAPTLKEPIQDNIFSKLAELMVSGIKKELKGFIGLCAFLCICSVIRLYGNYFSAAGAATDYICTLCTSFYCYSFTQGALDSVKTALSETDTFMSTMLPVMSSLYAVSGNASASISQNIGIYAAITLFEKINTSVLLPFFNFAFSLAIVCQTSSIDLSGVLKIIKNVVVRCCVTIITLLTALLFFKSTFSSAADTLAIRGVKYAVSLIPIVGAMAGEAVRTVAASISVIKTSAGIFAVTAVFYTVAVPCIILICKKTLLSICSVVGNVLGVKKEALFIEEINGILSILLAITVSVGIFFILAVTIFIKTAVII